MASFQKAGTTKLVRSFNRSYRKKNRKKRALRKLLREVLQPGHAIGTGGDDLASQIIQRLTRSPISHIAIYMGVVDGVESVFEAMDFSLTPREDDEGIYFTPFEDYLDRVVDATALVVLQPIGLNERRFFSAVRFLRDHSPTFPSFTLSIQGFLLAAETAGWTSLATNQKLLAMAGDGAVRMHCAEAAYRSYLLSDFPIRLGELRLERQSDLVSQSLEHLATLPSKQRRADRGDWLFEELPAVLRRPLNAPYAIGQVGIALLERIRCDEPTDRADLIVPHDLVVSPSFNTYELIPTNRGWRAPL